MTPLAERLLLASLLAALLVPQSCVVEDPPPTEIPYRRDGTAGKLIDIQVSVGGHAPQWFCVDTGAPHTVIDRRLADQLGLNAGPTTQLSGTGHGTVAAGHPGPQTLRIGAVSFASDDPTVVELKDVPINGEDRGLLGSELFEHYVVRIDGTRQTLTIFDPKTFQPDRRDTAVPLSTDGSRLYVDATLSVRPGLKVKHRLRIDTGSEDSVDDPIVKQARTTQKTRLGNGLGADYEGYSGIFDAVQVGPYRFQRVWGPSGDIPAVGMEILRRFVVTFDVPHRRLYLRPNAAFGSPIPAPGQDGGD